MPAPASSTLKRIAAAALLALPLWSSAAILPVTPNPGAWRLENYTNGSGVVVYFTSSPCPNGRLTFPASATPADIQRFWATVSVAKVSGRKLFADFDDAQAPAVCPIFSFGLDSE